MSHALHHTRERIKIDLGPRHTQAKSCDHEIVRAQMKVSKGRPTTPPNNHVMCSHSLECSVKSYVTMASTKCYFNECLFMQILTHDKREQINGCERSEYHGLPDLC
jgi:hypothetical protein